MEEPIKKLHRASLESDHSLKQRKESVKNLFFFRAKNQVFFKKHPSFTCQTSKNTLISHPFYNKLALIRYSYTFFIGHPFYENMRQSKIEGDAPGHSDLDP